LVIDASALVAILLQKPEHLAFIPAIGRARVRLMSSVNCLEAQIVLSRRLGRQGSEAVDALLHRLVIDVVPLTEALARQAFEAWRQFGKGNHPAKLNMGDCCAYALAREQGLPLLFKGNDFGRTDITPAVG
jgi:ribonuclease VapC